MGKYDLLKLVVSSYLLGNNVRYEGTYRHVQIITDTLSKHFSLLPVCPEITLGVPRPPVHLVLDGKNVRLVGINDPDIDATAPVQRTIDVFIDRYPDISGFILKRNSPSCGHLSRKIYSTGGNVLKPNGSGLFVTEIKSHYKKIPIIDENELKYCDKRAAFHAKIFAYYQLNNAIDSSSPDKAIQYLHSRYSSLFEGGHL